VLRNLEHSGLDLDDLRSFFVVAETGSFARAAQRLETSKSILSRRVARLEEQLGARLLQRTARGTLLTESGQLYYSDARAAVTQLECAAENLSQTVGDISGPIRLTGPVYFGPNYLGPALCDFAREHPGVEFHIHYSDDTIDIAREGFDLAVRLGQLPDSSLTLRRLALSRRMVVASPDYLANHPPILTPEDLSNHRIIHYSSVHTQEVWGYNRDGERHHLKINPYLRSNNAAMLMTAVAEGLGITAMPLFVTRAMLETGRAVEILTDYEWGFTQISLLMPPGGSTPKRVRALADFLVERFQNQII
jgi:DNA-binding transcriptional LysR family regulator